MKGQEKQIIENWNKSYETGKYTNSPMTSNVEKFYEDYLKNSEIKTIGFIGCGNGRNLIPLTKKGFATFGIDLSDIALKQLKEKIALENLNTEIQRSSFYNLPWGNKSLDCVIANNSLQHNDWRGAEKAFKEISRCLKKSGIAFVSVRSSKRNLPEQKIMINDNGITFIPTNTLNQKFGIKIHHYTLEELEKLAVLSGLQIISAKEIKKPPKNNNEKRWHWSVVFQKL